MKNSLVSFAVALALTGLACGTALAQVGPGFYNDDYLNSTGAAATSLDLTFSGDLTAALSGGGFVASFPYPGGTVLTGTIPQNTPVNGLTVTDSYDAGTNTTTLVYSGTASVVSGLSAHVGYSLLGGYTGQENTQSPAFLRSSWDNGGGTLLPANAALTETISGAGALDTSGTQATTYVLLHADVGFASGGGVTTSKWAEFEVPTDTPGTPWFENDSTVPIVLSSVGYQLSTTPIPLDQLNSAFEPADSFTPLGIPDGTTLQPGEAVPEPGTIVLLGTAAIALLGYLWRRRRQAA